jgi:hypothetical protein
MKHHNMLTNEKSPRSYTPHYNQHPPLQHHTTPLTPKKEMNNANTRLNTNQSNKTTHTNTTQTLAYTEIFLFQQILYNIHNLIS